MTMAKDRTQILREGEAKLREWQVPAAGDATGIESLRPLIGRDAAADVAIAARLGAIADPASMALLLELEGLSHDKLVHKETRRALYRLEQRGLKPPPPAQSPTLVPRIKTEIEGYVSSIDGRGDRLVWIVTPHAGHIDHLYAVINDPHGLHEVDMVEVSRKTFRSARQDLVDRHEIQMVEADWRYCDFLIDRAVTWSIARGGHMHGDYRALRTQLTAEPVREQAPLITSLIDTREVVADPKWLRDSHLVLGEKELRTWYFEPEALQPYVEAIQAIAASPLVLAEAQQLERHQEIIAEAMADLFGGEMQPSWVRRLQEMAYVFHITGRGDAARYCIAVADALANATRGVREISLCEALVTTGLLAQLENADRRQQEAERSQLVVTPQQALRERS